MNKLKGKKNIDRLFEEGVSVNLFPLRLLFVEDEVFSFGVSVGKRNFKLAVQRNRIKRQMRAAAKQHLLSFLENTKNPYSYMLIYTGKKMPEWNKLTEDFTNLAKKVSSKKL